MEQEIKKLPANDAIIMMVNAVNANNMTAFYQTVEKYIDGFIWTNPTRLTLKGLLNRRPLQMQMLNELSNDIKKLIIQGDGSDENVFLNEPTNILIEELILEWANIQAYQYHNLKVRNKILLHGITGNGKTTIAKYIAKKSDLPFVEVKAEEVIDSHLGSTGANIYNIFNKLKQPCVLFWDEVDSIGCKRGGDVKNSAGHENDRMTNSILVNLDKLSEEVIFIAATNRKEILDSAFIRRFDVQFEVMPPIEIEKERFATQLISYYKLPIETPDLSELKSYSDIKNCLVSIARDFVLNQIKTKVEERLN